MHRTLPIFVFLAVIVSSPQSKAEGGPYAQFAQSVCKSLPEEYRNTCEMIKHKFLTQYPAPASQFDRKYLNGLYVNLCLNSVTFKPGAGYFGDMEINSVRLSCLS